MRKLNNKGFSVSGILYPTFIIIISLVAIATSQLFNYNIVYQQQINNTKSEVLEINYEMELNKPEYNKISINETYVEHGVILKRNGNIVPSNQLVIISGGVSAGAGEYQITYTLKYNNSIIKRTVTREDYKYELILNKPEYNVLYNNENYIEYSVTVKDDGVVVQNPTNLHTSSGPTTTLGKHTITYSLNPGNKQITRDVYRINRVNDYAYTGGVQNFTAPVSGKYQIELWGAAGGKWKTINNPGKGAYTSGIIELEKDNKLYVFVGSNTTNFNGGSRGGQIPSPFQYGGGATDIRLEDGNWDSDIGLRSRIMVAGAGGGTGENSGLGGDAGGIKGYNGTISLSGVGAGQTAGGTGASNGVMSGAAGTFGKGGDGGLEATYGYGGGGGAGYYGGGGGAGVAGTDGAGAGGSSFISGHTGCVALASQSSQTHISGCNEGTNNNNCSIHYSGKKFTQTLMVDGNSVMPNPSGGSMIGNNGNGYARITYISSVDKVIEQKNEEIIFEPTLTGNYQIELWGASGGNAINSISGKGAYTKGIIKLEAGNASDKLYFHIGGQGASSNYNTFNKVYGGYNGGGLTTGQKCCSRSYGSGGGATDVRLNSGIWNDDTGLNSRIMVAGAGGGAFYNTSTIQSRGGSGGTLSGINGEQPPSPNNFCYGQGGTQTAGGTHITTGCSAQYNGTSPTYSGFGIGGYRNEEASTGGGSGYYGGGRSGHLAGAGGGSSFISGHTGCIAITSASNRAPKITGETTVHYSGKKFTNTQMIDGNNVMPAPYGGYMTGNNGNGYAKITYLGNY